MQNFYFMTSAITQTEQSFFGLKMLCRVLILMQFYLKLLILRLNNTIGILGNIMNLSPYENLFQSVLGGLPDNRRGRISIFFLMGQELDRQGLDRQGLDRQGLPQRMNGAEALKRLKAGL